MTEKYVGIGAIALILILFLSSPLQEVFEDGSRRMPGFIKEAKDSAAAFQASLDNPEAEDEDDEAVMETIEDDILCDSVPKLLANDELSPFEVNELRRNISLADHSCYEQHLPLFAKHFWSRHTTKHLNLHIPKAGGTTICKYVKEKRLMSHLGANCWGLKTLQSFCPAWCCCDKLEHQPASCEKQQQELNTTYFAMNENLFQGYCPNIRRMYSIMVREPVSRAMSNVNHYMTQFAFRGHAIQRLNLMQSNYMTWSLLAAIRNPTKPMSFRPRADDLPAAVSVLKRMDYIIDPSGAEQAASPQCLFAVYNLMGLGANVTMEIKNQRQNYQQLFDREAYAAMNQVDTELYQEARKMIRADCEFFLYLVENDERKR